MKTNGTYFVNDEKEPLRYGEINLINPERQRLRNEPKKRGIEAIPVFQGFCGTDFELMNMGARGELHTKFPEGENRLINGHEGVVWVPEENRFAIVLIRGGDSFDPTRYTEDESYFEYGCDGADGLFCDKNYFHPDMLLHLPAEYDDTEKLPLSVAKRLSFADPYACAIFQLERMEDIGEAQNFRIEMARHKCSEKEAREKAKEGIFERTVIFGLGMTGLFIGDQIRRNHPGAKILFVARSGEDAYKVRFSKEITGADYLCTDGLNEAEAAAKIIEKLGGRATLFAGTSGAEAESRIAFEHKALGCNGVYDSFSLGPKISFDTMPFGFENHVIFASINFRQEHMEKAIKILVTGRYDEVVELIDKGEFINNPLDAYKNKIFCKGAPLKTAVIWNKEYIDEAKQYENDKNIQTGEN
ncbi:MAG: hypothetical protein GX851_06875 [Clostridiales bacterium]|nr:hypothetical protein [Clostridiales bacterium]